MSAVSEILGRAMSDATFRAQLLDAPEEALAGYELSDEQRVLFVGLTAENFDALSGELEERLSKSMFSIIGKPTGIGIEGNHRGGG